MKSLITRAGSSAFFSEKGRMEFQNVVLIELKQWSKVKGPA